MAAFKVDDTVQALKSFKGADGLTIARGCEGKVLKVNSDGTYKVKWSIWTVDRTSAAVMFKMW